MAWNLETNIKGATGATGNPGVPGPPGADGSPDTAAQVLAKLLTVDGPGSGLNADLFDGHDSSYYATMADVESATGAGLFGYFDYTFNASNYTPPPIAGNFRMNNANQTLATHIYIHEQTATNNDAALMLRQINVGDKFLIQRKADASQWQHYAITAIADMGTYWDFTVTWIEGGSALVNARTGIIVQKPDTGIGEAPNDGELYARGSLAWQVIPLITVSSTAPSSPGVGDIWIDTT
jgi:hypothetical protein